MQASSESPDVLLIVEDEEPVRKTFCEWLEGANLGCRVLTAADAEQALRLADHEPIDLAILDWNLGAGHDGLRLLEDLYLFQPHIVAIMVTGYAHQATPLDALRMGVRDYLDKNQDLDRPTFLSAVRRQLDRLRPAKRERQVQAGLAGFRAAVSQVLPWIRTAAALNDPVPLPEAVRGLLRFLMQLTRAAESVLVVHIPQAQPEAESQHVFDCHGNRLEGAWLPFSRSLAGAASTRAEPCQMELRPSATCELQPFERGRHRVLAIPLDVDPGLQVVLELFDTEASVEDTSLARAAAGLGTEMLRQALAQKKSHRLLLDAVEASLRASENVTSAFQTGTTLPDRLVLECVHANLTEQIRTEDTRPTLELAEVMHRLGAKHGPEALRYCLTAIRELERFLDRMTAGGESPP